MGIQEFPSVDDKKWVEIKRQEDAMTEMELLSSVDVSKETVMTVIGSVWRDSAESQIEIFRWNFEAINQERNYINQQIKGIAHVDMYDSHGCPAPLLVYND